MNNFTMLSQVVVLLAGAVMCSATYAIEDTSYCGHEEHDNLELRSQASTLQYWRDETAANSESWVRFKILGFNDFHGALEQRTLFGRPVGGAAVLASYFKSEAEKSGNGAIIVHAGDHVGASPPISALLQDEPSITFMNMITNEYCEKPETEVSEFDSATRGHKQSYWASRYRCTG